eukprot:scaffold10570_cov129-Isochrysis_galbana.AAC.2
MADEKATTSVYPYRDRSSSSAACQERSHRSIRPTPYSDRNGQGGPKWPRTGMAARPCLRRSLTRLCREPRVASVSRSCRTMMMSEEVAVTKPAPMRPQSTPSSAKA